MDQKIFVTSDTHFGHENIIRYANRPFRDWREMGEAMIERWNARVTPEDKVYFLGDFAMGPGATAKYVIDVLYRLNGSKITILGNHDQPSKWSLGFKALVLDEVHKKDLMVLDEQIHNVLIDGKHFVMCHYPLADWNGKFHGTVHLHGHVHTQYTPATMRDATDSRRYDIGVDMYGGPVQITGDLRFLDNPKGWQ